MGVATGATLWAAGAHHVQVLLTFALGAFTMTTIVVEFHKGTRARAAIEKEGPDTVSAVDDTLRCK